MKVSIAIPCFNAERWLQQCVESALAQRGIEPEVIIVDDGSTDGSLEIASNFGERVRVLVADHRGATEARNLALQQATGEWVQFLDADDYLEPDKIRRQLDEAGDLSLADILYSPVWIETVSPTGSTREPSQSSPETDVDLQWIRWHLPQTGGALWRREPLIKLGGWKHGQPCCQEHELYLRARQAGLRFIFTPAPGAVYRIWSEETLCRKDPVLVTKTRTALMDTLLAWLVREGRQTPEHRRAVGQACFEMARTWARLDLAAASEYHAERKRRRLIQLAGPAAPFKYRLSYRLLGFQQAEKLAKRLR
jgi:hypothetical protein